MFVIEDFDCLPKRSLAQRVFYLIPIADMIIHLNQEVSLVIVIPIIVRVSDGAMDLCLALLPNAPDLLEIKDLSFLKVSEHFFKCLDGLSWFEWPLDLRSIVDLRGSCPRVIDHCSVCQDVGVGFSPLCRLERLDDQFLDVLLLLTEVHGH